MRESLLQLHPEGCAGVDGAGHAHAPPVELDQLANQGETDACSFVGAACDTGHTMEALENAGKLDLRDTDAGVSDLECHGSRLIPHADGDLSLVGELERIGHEIEDDLLPHIAIRPDGLRERWAVDD